MLINPTTEKRYLTVYNALLSESCITDVVLHRMLLHGLSILNQKPWSSKKLHVMELQSQTHLLPAKVTLGTMSFPIYSSNLSDITMSYWGCLLQSTSCGYHSHVYPYIYIYTLTKTFDFFCSVSDLLDFISPDQDSKGGDAQRKRRAKVIILT